MPVRFRVAILLCLPFLFLACHGPRAAAVDAPSRQPAGFIEVEKRIVGEESRRSHLQRVHDLEANGWLEADTLVTFDPQLYEEKVQIAERDLGPVKDASGELVYQICERLPAFPGGQAKLDKYLASHLRYPAEALKIKFIGQSDVLFVVGKDGRIRDVQAQAFQTGRREVRDRIVTREGGAEPLAPELNQLLEREAARVVAAMPKWAPARHHGEAVACRVTLPVEFEVK